MEAWLRERHLPELAVIALVTCYGLVYGLASTDLYPGLAEDPYLQLGITLAAAAGTVATLVQTLRFVEWLDRRPYTNP